MTVVCFFSDNNFSLTTQVFLLSVLLRLLTRQESFIQFYYIWVVFTFSGSITSSVRRYIICKNAVLPAPSQAGFRFDYVQIFKTLTCDLVIKVRFTLAVVFNLSLLYIISVYLSTSFCKSFFVFYLLIFDLCTLFRCAFILSYAFMIVNDFLTLLVK